MKTYEGSIDFRIPKFLPTRFIEKDVAEEEAHFNDVLPPEIRSFCDANETMRVYHQTTDVFKSADGTYAVVWCILIQEWFEVEAGNEDEAEGKALEQANEMLKQLLLKYNLVFVTEVSWIGEKSA